MADTHGNHSNQPQTEKEKIQEAILKVLTKIESASARLEKVEKQVNLGTTASPDSNVPPQVRDFDELVSSTITPLLDVSVQIGDIVEEHLDLIYTAIQGIRSLLLAVHECKKPSDLEEFTRPISELIGEISNFSEKHKGINNSSTNSKYSDHLVVLSKMSILSFVSTSNPASFIQQQKVLADPIVNKFLKDYKAKQLDCAVAENVLSFIKGLESLVQKYYSAGISWNSSGKDAPSRLEFSSRGVAGIPRGIPKLHVDSAKIFCENFSSEKKDIDCDKKQTIFIFCCSNSTITVKGKSSNIIIDSCSYSKIYVQESPSLTVLNSHRVEVISTGTLNSVSVEKTNGCTITLNEGSSACEIKVSASAQLFVGVPDEEKKGVEITEIPTQIKTKVKHGKLTTTLIDSNKQ